MKRINFVYSRNKLDFKKFAKSTEYDDVVSYHDIITKLVKHDDDNEKPTQFVINSYLRKKIIKVITKEDSVQIIYALNELNSNTIEAVRELMLDFYEGDDAEFMLTIIEHKKLEITQEEIDDVEGVDFLTKINYTTV